MFRKSAGALFRRHVAEWRALVIESFTNTQAITELIEACRRRTWDTEIQDIVRKIKPTGRAGPHNPVEEQIRETFGETECCPEEFAP